MTTTVPVAAVSYTAGRLRALESARRGEVPALRDRPASLFLERIGFLEWVQGGRFRLTPDGVALLTRLAAKPRRTA